MNELTKALAAEVQRIEENSRMTAANDPFRLKYHLMPPVGWLNDPNGLCYFDGFYHVFFQYSPTSAAGALKFWGHYISRDLISWEYAGTPLYPDSPYDCHGVYSGSAIVEDGKMHVFYTGKIKLDGQPGEYDYMNNGREYNTLYVVSEDGRTFGPKKRVLGMKDYPENYSCHIRDPKVWKENGKYYMVLGARKKDDKGAILLYESEDLCNWKFLKEITSEKKMGYMWECPDLFFLGETRILSVSPQGMERGIYENQNIYQNGYFSMEGELENGHMLGSFREWDKGFDFYAPQTFEDHKGRRILIGWMGMPDADDEYTNPTIENGWQHCLTVPRELRISDGVVYQYPVEEITGLRNSEIEMARDSKERWRAESEPCFDLEILNINGKACEITFQDGPVFHWKNKEAVLQFSGKAGSGRIERKARLVYLKEVRILVDTSAMEIYLNRGEIVFSTRFYPKEDLCRITLQCEDAAVKLWNMDAFAVFTPPVIC